MACEFYFSISRTAIEIAVLAAVTYATVYVIKDLMEEEETPAVINPVEG